MVRTVVFGAINVGSNPTTPASRDARGPRLARRAGPALFRRPRSKCLAFLGKCQVACSARLKRQRNCVLGHPIDSQSHHGSHVCAGSEKNRAPVALFSAHFPCFPKQRRRAKAQLPQLSKRGEERRAGETACRRPGDRGRAFLSPNPARTSECAMMFLLSRDTTPLGGQNMSITAIVLAAGEGTRMRSRHPKVAHKLLDRPLVSWPVRAAREAGAERVVTVVGHGADEVRAILANEKGVECVEQAERRGTGHAVPRRARGGPASREGTGRGALRRLAAACAAETDRESSCGRVEHGRAPHARAPYDDPSRPHRLRPHQADRRGGPAWRRIIEEKDCTPEQAARRSPECNAWRATPSTAAQARAPTSASSPATTRRASTTCTDMVEVSPQPRPLRRQAVHCDDYSRCSWA